MENESLLKQINVYKLAIDASKNENMELISSIAYLRKVNEKYRENEYFLQQK